MKTSARRYLVIACSDRRAKTARTSPTTEGDPVAIQTSIQLFTIKDQLETDLEGSLKEVAARGFTAVEPYDFCLLYTSPSPRD